MDAILSALCTYVSAQATDADPAAYGSEAPLVTAEVTTADGTINLTYAMGTDGCYLMVEGDSSVYTVDASVVSALFVPRGSAESRIKRFTPALCEFLVQRGIFFAPDVKFRQTSTE